jgi:hypothetical protein
VVPPGHVPADDPEDPLDPLTFNSPASFLNRAPSGSPFPITTIFKPGYPFNNSTAAFNNKSTRFASANRDTNNTTGPSPNSCFLLNASNSPGRSSQCRLAD